MKWSTIIKTHNIRVYDTTGEFSESLFYLDDNGLLCSKSECFTGVHSIFNDTLELFDNHINKMITENFAVELLPKEPLKACVKGWLVYKQGNDWVIDDEVESKYYYPTFNDAVQAANNMN